MALLNLQWHYGNTLAVVSAKANADCCNSELWLSCCNSELWLSVPQRDVLLKPFTLLLSAVVHATQDTNKMFSMFSNSWCSHTKV